MGLCVSNELTNVKIRFALVLIGLVFRNSVEQLIRLKPVVILVARGGIEPPTQGFSVRIIVYFIPFHFVSY